LTALVAAAGLALPWAAQADEVLVAVAANFVGPLAKLGPGFTAATGHRLRIVAGSTGKFYSQIGAGAPFEVLIAADDETPKKLIQEGLAVAGSNFTYAIGVLVLWSATPGYVDDQGAVLAAGKFNKLAIANPKLAPYGQAGMEVLKARGLSDAAAPKLVTAESIAQAYQFVATGNAELGFVALSQVIGAGPPQANERPPGGQAPKAAGGQITSAGPPQANERPPGGQAPKAAAGQAVLPGKPMTGSFWTVPASLHGEIRQDAVLLKPGEKKPAAAALLAYLKSAPAKALIQASGYRL
jgi:molybdate transport system substrate-binding protein